MLTKTLKGCAGALLLLVTALDNLFAAEPDSKTAAAVRAVDVSADHLEVDHGNRTAVFEGRVRATFGTLHLSCKKMSLQYTAEGEVALLSAWGGVVVKTDDGKANAESAKLDVLKGRIILRGNPSVVSGGRRLEGSTIEIDIQSGRVDVLDARGTFQLRTGASP